MGKLFDYDERGMEELSKEELIDLIADQDEEYVRLHDELVDVKTQLYSNRLLGFMALTVIITYIIGSLIEIWGGR